MKQYNNKTMKKGFTIIEVIVAIFVITVGVVGALGLVTHTISSVTISKDKLIAAYLAQEGIEIVRNIRDGNWLEQRWSTEIPPQPPWDYGMTYTSNYRLDYQSSEFPDTSCTLGPGNYLKYDGNFYSCLSGTDTKFKRKITIGAGPIADSLNVKVEVLWEEKGKPYSVEAQENLYNWH